MNFLRIFHFSTYYTFYIYECNVYWHLLDSCLISPILIILIIFVKKIKLLSFPFYKLSLPFAFTVKCNVQYIFIFFSVLWFVSIWCFIVYTLSCHYNLWIYHSLHFYAFMSSISSLKHPNTPFPVYSLPVLSFP